MSKEHSSLLKRAARVSSVNLVCHRDMWEFIAAHAGLHAHFQVPLQIADHSGERISTALSGRSLVAVLISLYNVMHTAGQGSGDREVATALYERIRQELTEPTAEGEPITITVDDRSGPGPDDAAGTPRPTSGPSTDKPEADADVGTPAPQPSESEPSGDR
ncbi:MULTISPECIES: hypothetical protein [Streptomyces]|uniref:hypothetical protein n=1 Tax=Streptomyces TaxID=1883 RepID=UPI000AC0AC7C|nr:MULTISPECIES: hypothetical protein [Streptomyces]